jgi:hypothetical protein
LQLRARGEAPWGPLPTSFPPACLWPLFRFLLPTHCPRVLPSCPCGAEDSACSCQDLRPGAGLHSSFARSLARASSHSSAPLLQPLRRPLSAGPLCRRARARSSSTADVPWPLRAAPVAWQAPRRARAAFSRFFKARAVWCWPPGLPFEAPVLSLPVLRPFEASQFPRGAGLAWLHLELPRDSNRFSSSQIHFQWRWVRQSAAAARRVSWLRPRSFFLALLHSLALPRLG